MGITGSPLPLALAIRTGRGVNRDSRVRTAGRTPAQPTSRDVMHRPPSPDGNVCPRRVMEWPACAVLRNPATRGCPKQNPGSARLSVKCDSDHEQSNHA